MKKNIKPKNKKKNFILELEKIYTPSFKYCAFTLFIVFFVYSFSLFRPWQPFDERAIYSEVIFPFPSRFQEIFEIIKSFAHNAHIVSMNYFFSDYATLRSDPATWTILVFMFYFFKKNALLYHLFQLTIHLINTLLVWLILDKVTNIGAGVKPAPTVVSIFTLLWALHPVNTEAVLLVTNWNANITYTFCLGFVLYEVSKLTNENYHGSKTRTIVITILLFLTTFIAEYSYTMPALIFLLIFSYIFKKSNSLKKAFLVSCKLSLPYFIGLVFFAFYIFSKTNSPLDNLTHTPSSTSSLYVFLERNLWLTPQIFVHFFKLFFFPINLSTYQSNLIHLANNLFEPYSVFCTAFYLLFIILPLVSFIIFHKKTYSYIFILFYSFYFSLFPFLHIVLPTYCLSADRYCYFPLFFLLFILFHLICKVLMKENLKLSKALIITFSCILLLLSLRTIIRIKDWYDPARFYQSAIKLDKNSLYKAYKLSIFADYLKKTGKESERSEYLKDALNESYKALSLFKSNKKKHPFQPITLKLYGLDYGTLTFKSAFLIAAIKNDHLEESPKEILAFFEPYIKNKKYLRSINSITLYSKILSRDGQILKAKEILEYGLKLFPYSYDILLSLANYHLDKNDLTEAFELLQTAYKYFPYEPILLEKFLTYYSKNNDHLNEARFAYLIGLRMHSLQGYQKAASIYLDLNQFDLANVSLKKAIRLNPDDPLTLLLTSRYLDLTGRRSKILPVLNRAFLSSKALGEKQDINVTKSILASLINVYSQAGDTNTANKLLDEFESIRNLNIDDKKLILELKSRLRLTK